MNERNLKQVDILSACQPYCQQYNVKLAKNDLSQYISGKVQPGQDKLTILGMALNVNEVWLMGYDVPAVKETALQNGILKMPTMKEVPLMGRIACGDPILADENIERYVNIADTVDADFALECRGDSMIGARIYDGDVVYIKMQSQVDNGTIAAVLIGEEATLKRVYYYPDKNMVILKAENKDFPDLVYTGEELNDIRVIGKAVTFMSVVR